MDESKFSREELQRMLDQAADQAVTQGIALVRFLIRQELRNLVRSAGYELLKFLWKPALLALLFLLGIVAYKLRGYL